MAPKAAQDESATCSVAVHERISELEERLDALGGTRPGASRANVRHLCVILPWLPA